MKVKVLLILFYSIGSISILRSGNVPVTLLMILSTLYSLKRVPRKEILKLFKFMIVTGILYSLLSGRLPILFLANILIFYGTYVIASDINVGLKLITSFRTVMRTLLVFSLVFWILHILFGSTILSLVPFDLNSGKSISIGIYNFHFRASTLFSIPFNSGFAWEPGPFAIVLFIGLLSEVMAGNRNRRFLALYVLAILSTLSDTGYILLTTLVMYFITDRYGMRKVVVLLGIFVIWMIYNSDVISLSEYTDKINEEFEMYIVYGKERMTSIGRFTGFLFNLQDFSRFPFFGYGPRLELTLSNIKNLNIWSTSGLGNFIAQFGIIGIMFLSVVLGRLKGVSNLHGRLLLIGSFLVITFAFNVLLTPLMALYLGVFRHEECCFTRI